MKKRKGRKFKKLSTKNWEKKNSGKSESHIEWSIKSTTQNTPRDHNMSGATTAH